MMHTHTEERQDLAGASPPPRPAHERVRVRALVIGALSVVLTVLLVTQAELVLQTLKIGYLQFPPVALGLLLLAVAVSRAAGRVVKRWSLTSTDLLIIYCMTLVGAMVASHGVVEKFIPLLMQPKMGANAGNRWFDLYAPHIPQRLVPWNVHDRGRQQVVSAFLEGLHRGEVFPWRPWVLPVLNWGLLIFLVLFAFLCLASLLRRQWADLEKLSFPLAQLPLEIAGDQDAPGFFRNKVMWAGVLIPVVIYAVKFLHLIALTIPDITLQWTLGDYLSAPPWNQIGYTTFVLSFAAVGFFFLLPADVLLSIWFFFLLTRVEQAVMISQNQPMPGMPIYPTPLFVGYQTIGAYLVLSGYFLWIARPHLKRVWASALGRPGGYSPQEDAEELMPYRFAVWGLLGSILAAALWTWGMGMSLWLALFELVVFIFVTALVLARSTAEAGMLMTETTFRPIDLYRMVAPVHLLGAQNITLLALFDTILLRDQRGLLLCGMLDAARLSDGAKVRRRSFAWALALGIVLAFAVAVPLDIFLPYHLGAAGQMDPDVIQGQTRYAIAGYAPALQGQDTLPTGASWQMPAFFGVGVILTVFLTVMRTAFFWWPLHPLGYALSGSWSTIEFWFPCLVAWTCKSLILRYGGMSGYVRVRPFFLGLVLGEFGMAVLFVLLSALSAALSPGHKIPAPAFPWG